MDAGSLMDTVQDDRRCATTVLAMASFREFRLCGKACRMPFIVIGHAKTKRSPLRGAILAFWRRLCPPEAISMTTSDD